MDRNQKKAVAHKAFDAVALRKESVDRNFDAMQVIIIIVESLSARRAWIEIASGTLSDTSDVVALRKESVDRNKHAEPARQVQGLSLSARRAWIEIQKALSLIEAQQVALRKESVDRNGMERKMQAAVKSRSPQGERG